MNLNGLSALGWRFSAKETFKKTINILQGRQLLRFNCSKTTFTKCCQHPDLLSGSGAECFYINCNLSWWRDSMWRNKHLCVLCPLTICRGASGRGAACPGCSCPLCPRPRRLRPRRCPRCRPCVCPAAPPPARCPAAPPARCPPGAPTRYIRNILQHLKDIWQQLKNIWQHLKIFDNF